MNTYASALAIPIAADHSYLLGCVHRGITLGSDFFHDFSAQAFCV